MKATIRLVVITAFRDRFFSGLFLLLALSTALSIFLAGTALSEQLQMAIAFVAGAGRIVLVLGLTIFAAFHMQALFETREVEAILARAISRAQFVLAYWIGLSVLAIILAGAFAAVLWVIAGATFGTFLWAITLLAECIVVVAVAVFAGLMLERATPTVMFTMGFYALARLMGFFVGIRETVENTAVNTVITRGLDVVLLFIPRLDLMAQTQWIIYGPESADVGFLALQVVLFLALVLLAATFDLSRKQF
ncbi:MAG: hypothetical protein K2P94_14330 [Rhodospirillaceae bacterium]|nr:hypothetical protein [Rhodospirillaceae bacterium]